jgi:hypothetical protein
MVKAAKLALWAIVAVVFTIAFLWAGGLLGVPVAVGQSLRPASIDGVYFPRGCVKTTEMPPPDLMRVVEDQEQFYGLALRRLIVCRSSRRLPAFEARHVGLQGIVGEESGCRPLYKGCCSCQVGRHIIVIAADPKDQGSLLMQADLVQSRWDHIRLAWNKRNRTPWFWWWPICGMVLLTYALWRILKTAT